MYKDPRFPSGMSSEAKSFIAAALNKVGEGEGLVEGLGEWVQRRRASLSGTEQGGAGKRGGRKG